ncbi:MAG: Hsp20/alpha crystallin family protein [Phycisphaerales bacterium]|jgi:HSP20 family protein|nr:Hsp20/alpha crystallin family protein [Phycisphaerales bacterium]
MVLELAAEPFKTASRQMGSLLDAMQKGYYGFCRNETWTPAVNLYENESAYLVCVDLAGVDKTKIHLEVVDHQLTIRGTREVPNHPDRTEAETAGKVRVHLMEIDHGGFSRLVELPVDVSRETINATYRDGMLWIELPKQTP